MKLRISDTLSLPIDAVTQKLAFLGRTGSGKSYGATKVAEEMLRAKAQIVVLDPVGVWWGLRTGSLDAAPKGGGFDVPVFGGLHGDLPLEPGGGALVADLIAERGISAIIDVSQFLVGEQRKFGADFATQLFQRKKAAPSPVHFFIEEAQEFIPQKVQGDVARMVGAFERLIKLGRNFGVGASLISQRPQSVNKDVLNQTECLFAFQMTGPQERKAIESWVQDKGADENIVATLPKLRVGEAHVWSPQWLKISETIKIARKLTADVSSTPAVGKRAEVHHLAAVDVAALKELMAATVEKAKREDPRELRKKIEELTNSLARAAATNAQLREAASKVAEKPVEVPVLKDEQIARIEKILAEFKSYFAEASGFFRGVESALEPLAAGLRDFGKSQSAPRAPFRADIPDRSPLLTGTSTAPAPKARSEAAPATGSISGGMRRMMIALAQRGGLNARQLGVRAAMSSSSGTFGTYLGKLRSSGWLEGSRDGMSLTPAGIAALGDYEPLPTGRALLNHWIGELGATSGLSRILQALANAYPKTLTKEELGARAGISHISGTFGTYLGKLRTLELIHGSRELQASPEFFE